MELTRWERSGDNVSWGCKGLGMGRGEVGKDPNDRQHKRGAGNEIEESE